jgi:hypothetical protein
VRNALPATVGIIVLAVTFALAIALPVAAAPLDPRGEDWEGLSQLVALATTELGAGRVVVSQRLDLGRLQSADALVLIHPERDLDAEELSAFMRSGGRVALFDDYGSGDGLLAHFGIRRVPLPEHPSSMLRSNPSFAIADAVGIHPAVRNVERVVTNHATGLADARLAPLLIVRAREGDVVLGVAGVVGQGRLVAVGDASIPMNAMLRYPGNRELTLGLIRYVADSPSPDASPADRGNAGAVEGKVYILAGDFAISGRFGAPWQTDPEGAALRVIGETADALRQGLPPIALYLAALATGLGVVFWTGRYAGRTHKRSVPRFARPIPLTVQGGIAGHAASLTAGGISPVQVMVELRTAIEEQLATRLGLDHVVSHNELVARVKATGLLDEGGSRTLAAVLDHLGRFGTGAGRRHGLDLGRPSEAQVREAAYRVRSLLAAVDARRHGSLVTTP